VAATDEERRRVVRACTSKTAPAWANTYVLGLFVVQLALFGVVFLRVLRIVALQGVVSVLDQGFKDSVRRSVEDNCDARGPWRCFAESATVRDLSNEALGADLLIPGTIPGPLIDFSKLSGVSRRMDDLYAAVSDG
jgi:hypothetical protein